MPIFANLTETVLHRAVDPWQRTGTRLNIARYHLRQARICEKILAHVEKTEGRRLDPALARRAEAYAVEVFGWGGYAPWLKVYAALTGEFREGWIPDDYYAQVVSDRINGAYRQVAQLRQVAPRLFGLAGVPDSVHAVRGLLLTPDGAPIAADQLAGHVFAKGDKAIFKTTGSWAGQGIRILRRDSFVAGETWPDGVFQHFIEAHPALLRMHASATSTLRLTTAIGPDGKPALHAAYLRIARGKDEFIKQAGFIRLPLELDTGEFWPYGLWADWTRVERHPDSGVVFAGQSMPGFAAARDMALSFHGRYPLVGCVGWDFAVDAEERPWLLEWNAMHNDIKLSEATQGPCFKGLGWETLWKTAATR